MTLWRANASPVVLFGFQLLGRPVCGREGSLLRSRRDVEWAPNLASAAEDPAGVRWFGRVDVVAARRAPGGPHEAQRRSTKRQIAHTRREETVKRKLRRRSAH